MTRLYIAAATAQVWVLLAILAGAFAAQLLAGEPPCPLCVMQRIGMMLAALGPASLLIAARRGPLSERDIGVSAGLSVLASLLGAAIATRQVLLHILPDDPGFGSPIMGYHLYTWALIVFCCNLLAAGLQLLGLAWFVPDPAAKAPLAGFGAAALAAMLVANTLSVVAEAGFAWHLPDNPVTYLLFRAG